MEDLQGLGRKARNCLSAFQNKVFQKQIRLNLRNKMLSGELEGCSYKSETQQEELGRDKPTMSRAARASQKHNVKDCDGDKFVNNEQRNSRY